MAVAVGMLRPQRVTLLVTLLCAFALAFALHGQSPLHAEQQHLHARQEPAGGYAAPAPAPAPAAEGEFRMPPQAPPLWNATAESIVADMKKLIDGDRTFTDGIVGQISASNATFANVLVPSAQNANRMSLSASILTMYNSIATDKALRDASDEAQSLYDKYSTESTMRQDYFALIEALAKRQNSSDAEDLDGEDARLLDMTYRDFLAAGLGLPEGEGRERYKNISDRIDELQTQFARNLNEDDSALWLTEEELDGAPRDTLSTWEKGTGENEGKLKLILRSPDARTVTQYLTNATVRQRIWVGRENRNPENVPLFEEAVELRDEGARLLGFPNHAAYKLQERLLDTPEKVESFLKEVRDRLTPKGEQDLKNLTEVKMADAERTNKEDEYLFAWDQSYYERKYQDENYNLDPQKVQEYFPSTIIIREMLAIYSQLFGLEFYEVKDADLDKLSPTGNGSDIIWHPDTQLFAVWDSEAEGDDFVGYLYLDLFPRDGKYGHAANFNIQPGFLDLDNDRKRHFPVTSLICNFPKPTANKPSLMSHDDVTTIFHELGHGIHNLVSRTTYSYFHGTNVFWDFVEAPSQMLENWAWTPVVLKNISQHYSYLSDEYKQTWQNENNGTGVQQPEERMPDQMIDNLILNKNYDIGLINLRQIALGTYDMTVHTPATHQEIVDMPLTVLWNQNMKNVSLMNSMELVVTDESKKWTWGHGQSAFGHLMGGYDAGYYGYMSSLVYAEDMFYTVFKKDPFSSEEGRRYRHTLLQPGGSVAPMKLLTDFLGREPNQDAFFENMGFS
ncbi:putative metallopeptidase protein [Neofusicoccum parvum]|nr:putative metallopeptidase protein [Neofusicoccum parvum]